MQPLIPDINPFPGPFIPPEDWEYEDEDYDDGI